MQYDLHGHNYNILEDDKVLGDEVLVPKKGGSYKFEIAKVV